MAATASSYSITMRLYTAADHSVVGAVATTIAHNGGIVTAIDVAESRHDRLTVDVTCSAADATHSQELVAAVSGVEGVTVHKVSDRTFLLHLGGKISVQSKVPLRTRDDLSMAYTPGVGRVSMAIHDNPEDVRKLTIKGNSVAVVTDGSAVLGLGNIGPGAAMPVMEGKAALFKRFADIDAWPICLASQDTDVIVKAVEMIAPGFGGINLEDIAAPNCFIVERALREELDIPVFHDDQHGTAIVVLAALQNAAAVVGRPIADLRVVIAGAGAAGIATARLLRLAGVRDIVLIDRHGIVSTGRDDLNREKLEMARTLGTARRGSLVHAVANANVFIGLSGPRILSLAALRTMARPRIVFAMANPDPEIDPLEAAPEVDVLATGRSDYPNQVNNVLAFPGVFRGLLDARARGVSSEVELAAAAALAATVPAQVRSAEYILPSVFDRHVVPAIAKAVAAATRDAGLGRSSTGPARDG